MIFFSGSEFVLFLSAEPEAGLFFVSLQSREGPAGPPGEMGRPGIEVRCGLYS